MAFEPNIVTVNLDLQNVFTTRQGFGIPLVVSEHANFPEVVRSYPDITAVAEDFATTDPVYLAANNTFQQNPQVSQLIVGRQDADTTVTIPADIVTGGVDTFTFTVSVTDKDNNNVIASYTAGGADTPTTVTAELATQLTTGFGDPLNVPASSPFILVDNAGSLTFSMNAAGDVYQVDTKTLVNLDPTYVASTTSIQTAADVVNLMVFESTEWYFYQHTNHDPTWVTDTATAIEATPQKVYFMSTDDADVIAAAETDFASNLRDLGYDRTSIIFHHDADVRTVETGYTGFNAPFIAGSVVWSNIQVVGLDVSQDPATGKKLTNTQLTNLSNKNVNFVKDEGGVPVVREGKMISGEWIDNIRGLDDLVVNMTADLQDLLLSQKGSKLPYTDDGINQVDQVVRNAGQRSLNNGYLSGYRTTFPKASDIPASKKNTRVYDEHIFQGTLAGAIIIIKISGILTQ